MKLQIMSKKNLSIIFVILIFLFCVIFIIPHDKAYKVIDVISPNSFLLNNRKIFKISEIETFDAEFTQKNSFLAKNVGISEADAFILGNLAKEKARNLMKGRKVFIKNDSDLIYYRNSYKEKFFYSGFCFKENKPINQEKFNQILLTARKANYRIFDLDSGNVYKLNDSNSRNLKNYILVRKSHLSKLGQYQKGLVRKTLYSKNIKVFMTDFTKKLVPDKNCNSEFCKEILNNINSAKKSIDIAVYGYSRVPALENALQEAQKRGVNIRLVYDLDNKGKNIYPNTKVLVDLLSNNRSDMLSKEAYNTMHNKFYIFDDKTVVTGSANLSHTDMSEYNSNIVVSINSDILAKIYKKEFEQMFQGKFHNDKESFSNELVRLEDIEIQVYFSPQDKGIEKAILSLINNAKRYIYIPTFVLTHKKLSDALILAKQRGVDVKIIMDALSVSTKHSKINELRNAGVEVKTENYAGKMHSKSMFIDDKYSIIGSMNFSNSGENKNDENFLVVKDAEITKAGKDFFLYQWENIDNKWLKQNPRAESVDSIGSCFDGIDNDYDGLIDNAEDACKN